MDGTVACVLAGVGDSENKSENDVKNDFNDHGEFVARPDQDAALG